MLTSGECDVEMDGTDLFSHEEVVETMEIGQLSDCIPNDTCVICKAILKGKEKLSEMTPKGVDSLVSNCETIGQKDVLNFVKLNRTHDLFVHGSCRRAIRYEADKAGKKAECESGESNRRLTRSSTGNFSYITMCFLCGETVENCNDKRKVLAGEQFDKQIMVAVHSRNEKGDDDWAVKVQGRLDAVADLFSADAVYHHNCLVRFTRQLPHTPHKVKRGRPIKLDAMTAFEQLCVKLESECENEMYTLRELHAMMCDMVGDVYDSADSVYSVKYFKDLLETRYGNHIYFASRPGRDDVVGFTKFCELLLHNKFFSDRNEGEGSEAERVVQKAAGLIMAEIREMESDRSVYPTQDDITCESSKFIPPLLSLFLKRLIRSPLKQSSIGQALVQAVRPQGGLMPLLFGVGVELHDGGFQSLHMKLARMGFSLSYDEIRRYNFSVMQMCHGLNNSETTNDNASVPVVHFVADNVDHNVRTIDGLNTIHAMGIISTTVFPEGVFGQTQRIVPRSLKPIKACDAVPNNRVPIVSFQFASEQGVKRLRLDAIRSLQRPIVLPAIVNLNVLWHAAGMMSAARVHRPNWSGYMQSVCKGYHTGVSVVEMLTIIDLNPGDEDCIYSTMLFVEQQAKSLKIGTPDLTFDQPLYLKAVDIALKSKLDVVIRLGGFHTLISFLGAIGHLMKGSGLEEVFGLIFGSNTVEHVMSGKAYDRAVRGHFLVHAALTSILLDYISKPLPSNSSYDDSSPIALDSQSTHVLAGSLTAATLNDLDCLYEQTVLDGFDAENSTTLDHESLETVITALENLKQVLSYSRTSRLWLLYMSYVDHLKLFIAAERTSNWLLHLHAVQGMLGLFAATGHNNYAKSGRLYLQQMEALPHTHPILHAKFTDGYHTVRRSDRYWAGLSLDLVIEQTMMRAIKSRGGLTRGRGMHESVRETWMNTLTERAGIRSALSLITRTERSTPEHVEVGQSRMGRDWKDLCKVKDYLLAYSPFRFWDCERLINPTSGVVAGPDESVNCEVADKVGCDIQAKWDNMLFGDVVCKRVDQVKNLSHVTNACSIGNDKVNIDPCSLFHRLVLVGERMNNVRHCFSFELTPYPTSLFKDSLMRKPDKPSLLRHVLTDFTNHHLPGGVQYVVDGGYLLHKVRWNVGMDMCDIIPLFIAFLRKLGCNVHIVFDGYASGPSTKDHEHGRRVGKGTHIAPLRKVDMSTKQVGQQDGFLANVSNKTAFIDLLTQQLLLAGFPVTQAQSDADIVIVSVALTYAEQNIGSVAVLGEDTDLLVLLIHHRKQTMSSIYFVSPPKKGKGGQTVGGKCINIESVQVKLGFASCAVLLVVHALGGCDTTSAIYGIGKGTVFTRITDNAALQNHCMTLQCETADAAQVTSAGIELLVALYGGKVGEKLENLRYATYCKISLGRRFHPERLPPSEGAAAMHAMRVHYQAVVWGQLTESGIQPTDWGWQLERNCLVPIKLSGEVAPGHMLTMVRCSCKGNCSSSMCSCRKHGLKCVSACGHCHGTECNNVSEVFVDDKTPGVENNATSDSQNPDNSNLPDFMWADDFYVQDEEEILFA